MTVSDALSFVLCCTGVSVLIVSIAGSVRLARRSGAPARPRDLLQERRQPVAEPLDTELSDRLKQFQTNRFAPVIRPLDEATTPVRRPLPARLRRPPQPTTPLLVEDKKAQE